MLHFVNIAHLFILVKSALEFRVAQTVNAYRSGNNNKC